MTSNPPNIISIQKTARKPYRKKKLTSKIKHFFAKLGRIPSDIERWVAYRTYDKYNVVKIPTLTPHYYDKDTILLHANFAVLVNYVERELAHMESIFGSDLGTPEERAKRYLDFWEKLEPEVHDGVDINERTREKAKEIRALYDWWKHEFPNRKDSSEICGLDAFYDNIRSQGRETHVFTPIERDGQTFHRMDRALNEEEDALYMKLIHESFDIEEKQHQEDEDMLIRLIKIRRFLWT